MHLDLVAIHLEKNLHAVLQLLMDSLSSFLGIKVRIRTLQIDPKLGLEPLRDQYHSSIILNKLSGFTHQSLILGVTGVDLYIPIFTFVMGEAQLKGNAALVSVYRLQNSTYGLPEDPELLLDRLEKLAFHEMAHMLGLTHCIDSNCVMHAASSVEEVDIRSNAFCLDCQAHLNRKVNIKKTSALNKQSKSH